MNGFAKKMVELRGQKTQKEVAAAIGVTTSAISMYERGERTPRDDIKVRIASYYGKSVGEIFYRID